MAKHLVNLHSNAKVTKTFPNETHPSSSELMGKKPTPEKLEYGEIAVNYAADTETINIKNSNDEIVGFLNENVIYENERIVAEAIADLHDKKQNKVIPANITYPILGIGLVPQNASEGLLVESTGTYQLATSIYAITGSTITLTNNSEAGIWYCAEGFVAGNYATRMVYYETAGTHRYTVVNDGYYAFELIDSIDSVALSGTTTVENAIEELNNKVSEKANITDLAVIKGAANKSLVTPDGGNSATHVGAIALGNSNNAKQEYAICLGEFNNSTGWDTFAVGTRNTIQRHMAMAIGRYNVARAWGSIAIGLGVETFDNQTDSNNDGEIAIGRYNTPSKDKIFTIGCGTSSNDRKNAIEINANGKVSFPQSDYVTTEQLGDYATTDQLGVATFPYEKQYMTFVTLENCTFTFTKYGTGDDIQYSTDNGVTWNSLVSGTGRIQISPRKTVMWKATLLPSSEGIGFFNSTGDFKVEGNIMSLIHGDDFIGQTSLENKNLVFCSLFANNSHLTDASNFILPATTLSYGCYMGMFFGCGNLTAAPELPAALLTNQCYASLFQGCRYLNYIKMLATNVSAPECLTNWVSGVAASGTFVKDCSATWDIIGVDGVPSNWDIKYNYNIIDEGFIDLGTFNASGTAENEALKTKYSTNPDITLMRYYVPTASFTGYGFITQKIKSDTETFQWLNWQNLYFKRTVTNGTTTGWTRMAQISVDDFNNKQNKLTAGSNISINNNVISATDTTYIAGNNIQINNNVISATDTTYTAGSGISIQSNNTIQNTFYEQLKDWSIVVTSQYLDLSPSDTTLELNESYTLFDTSTITNDSNNITTAKYIKANTKIKITWNETSTAAISPTLFIASSPKPRPTAGTQITIVAINNNAAENNLLEYTVTTDGYYVLGYSDLITHSTVEITLPTDESTDEPIPESTTEEPTSTPEPTDEPTEEPTEESTDEPTPNL